MKSNTFSAKLCYYAPFILVIVIVCAFLLTSYTDIPGNNTIQALSSLKNAPVIPNINADALSVVNRLIIIPGGGGGGTKENPGYPEWTKRRVSDSFQFYKDKLSEKEKEQTLFILLSAGSFNTPNSLLADNRIIFECQHMINHLKELGISQNKIVGDIFSWDTVTNGLALRLLLEGVCLYSKHTITLDVFISDFHLLRMQTVLEWTLGLEPSLLTASPSSPKVNLIMHSVSSEGIPSLTKESLESRVKHEEKGVQMIKNQMKSVRTLQEFHAFVMLGGHAGIRNYLMSDYVKSSGGGW
jgi:hypothetical protein